MAKSNRQWILKKRPVGDIKPGDLEFVETPLPEPGPGEFLARTVYLSLDPTNRIWMSDMEQYMPPVQIGEVMRGGTLSVVERIEQSGFQAGRHRFGFHRLAGIFGDERRPEIAERRIAAHGLYERDGCDGRHRLFRPARYRPAQRR